jgi:hypothetical protein
VTGALYGFQPVDPNIHKGKQDDHRNLLRQRYRSLYRSLLALNTHLSEKRGLYGFSTNLNKNYGVFDIRGIKVRGFKRTQNVATSPAQYPDLALAQPKSAATWANPESATSNPHSLKYQKG